jgi:hypothetical protein
MYLTIYYKFNLQSHNKEICSDWKLTFKWHIGARGNLIFKYESLFDDCNDRDRKNLFSIENLFDKYFLFNILLLFFSISELIICLIRLLDSYKNTKLVKMNINHLNEKSKKDLNVDIDKEFISIFNENKLNNLQIQNNHNNTNNKNNDTNYNDINNNNEIYSINNNTDIEEKILHIRKMGSDTKWDLLTFTDKLTFFNLWLILFVLGNIFQILSVLINIVYPRFAENNMLLNAFSCMFAWFSIGYFLDYKKKEYSIFYKIVKYSFSQFMFIFFLCFIFFFISIIWKIVTFYKSDNGIDLHTSAIWLFSFIFNEDLMKKINTMFESERFLYFILSVIFFYLLFNLIFMRIFLSLIEEVFEKVSLHDTFSWLENKMSFSDYIKSQAKELKNKGN